MATAEKPRCIAVYKNGNPCRAYAVHGYLCTRHQHLRASTEMQMKIAEIERRNSERERRINEIVAQEAHTRLLTAPVFEVPSSGSYYSGDTSFIPFDLWDDIVNRYGTDTIFPYARSFTGSGGFLPYRNLLEHARERQAELCRLTGSIRWGQYVRKFYRSNLLCREFWASSEDGYKIIRCINPLDKEKRGKGKCLPCRRKTQAMYARWRRDSEEAGACKHGSDCWPSLDTVITLGRGCCYYCGVSVTRGTGKNTNACRDHYIPVSRGGPHCKDNVVLACRHCNGNKHDNMPPPPRETPASIHQGIPLPGFV